MLNRCFSNALTVLGLLVAAGVPGAAASCADPGAEPVAAAAAYGGEIEFAVARNGEPVGRHRTTFNEHDGYLDVRSELDLAVQVLFVTVYRYHYVSEERWCGGRLVGIEARVNDNGDRFELRGAARGGALEVDGSSGRAGVPLGILATTHWNPEVLDRREVLNTLTGRLNEVTIEACGREDVPVAGGRRSARCFEYTGDLQARVWYDDAGRWVGLQFPGPDGSTIRYACDRCGKAPGGGA